MYKFIVFVAVLYFLFWDFSGLFSFSISSFPFILTAFFFPILSLSLSPPVADRRYSNPRTDRERLPSCCQLSTVNCQLSTE
ncbi:MULTISPECIES: hypothetical protein [unclassified Microcoleus]|uniref:hypothetical protein n=1 Tax=unclassified Microcoleus TaxID=2642155 RepID=UPI0025D70598|nr:MULTISPECIES: hypothetical protein [unclassified Microcoleus]